MMTDQQLREIEARCEAAMPGPWEWANDVLCAPEPYYVALKPWHDDDTDKTSVCCYTADRAFIAHSRQDIPALLAEVRRLRRELRTAYNACAEAAEMGIEE